MGLTELIIIDASFYDAATNSIGNATRTEVPATFDNIKLAEAPGDERYSAQVIVRRIGDRVQYRVFLHVPKDGTI